MDLPEEIARAVKSANPFSTDVTMSGSFDFRVEESAILGNLLNSLPIPALILGKPQTIIFANRACSHLGQAHKDLEGNSLSVLFRHAGRAEKISALVARVFDDRRPRITDLILGLGKVRLWGRTRFRSIRLRGVQHVLVLIEDLTADRRQLVLTRKYTRDLQKARDELETRVRHRTRELEAANELMRQEIERSKSIEEKLNASEKRYRGVVEDQTEMIWRFLPDGTLTFVNGACCRFMGKEAEELIGRSYFELMPEPYAAATRKQLMPIDEANPVVVYDHLFSTPGEGPRWHRRFDRGILDDRGDPVEYQCVARDITPQKVAEEALKESEEKYRLLIESLPIGVLIVQDGEIAFMNRTGLIMFGLEKRDPGTTNRVMDFVADEDKERIAGYLAEHFREPATVPEYYEAKLRRSNGNEFPAELHVRTVTYNGRPAGQVAVFDVTERQHARDALIAGEERYRTIFEGAPVSIVEEDTSQLIPFIEDLRARGIGDIRAYMKEHPEFVREASRKILIVNANQASRRLYGANTNEELFGTVERIFQEETFDAFEGKLAAIASQEPFFEAESVGRTLQGDRIDVLLRVAIPAPTARFKHLLVSKVDITERKRAEASLSQAKEEWERTFDAVPDLVAIIDRNHRVVRVNRAMAQRVGCTPEEVIGKHCYHLFHGDDDPPDYCPHVRMMQDGQEHISETTEEKFGGTYLVSVTPLYDGNHEVAGCVHVARDITERKRLEAELERQATRDSLTGLLNRRHFLEVLTSAHQNATRYGFPLSLAILDLDNFKEVNDRYGHQQGDEVLRRFGAMVRLELRSGDLAGRYGGDEFIIAFPHTSAKNAAESLERIRRRLQDTDFGAESKSYGVHCTAGVAELPLDGATVDFLISLADKAMYEAKAKGRNRVVAYQAPARPGDS